MIGNGKRKIARYKIGRGVEELPPRQKVDESGPVFDWTSILFDVSREVAIDGLKPWIPIEFDDPSYATRAANVLHTARSSTLWIRSLVWAVRGPVLWLRYRDGDEPVTQKEKKRARKARK